MHLVPDFYKILQDIRKKIVRERIKNQKLGSRKEKEQGGSGEWVGNRGEISTKLGKWRGGSSTRAGEWRGESLLKGGAWGCRKFNQERDRGNVHQEEGEVHGREGNQEEISGKGGVSQEDDQSKGFQNE